jgi:putative acetyltransferase
MSPSEATSMKITIREMTAKDLPQAFSLWNEAEGIHLGTSDTPAEVGGFLLRNPGLSLVAVDGPTLVGAVLAGHDGRRGYLHHVAVRDEYRQRGLGRELVRRCVEALAEAGIAKCHVFVFTRNQAALDFWGRIGWTPRDDLELFSKDTGRRDG